MSHSSAAVLSQAPLVQRQPEPAGSSASFAFERLPHELQLTIIEELPYRALKRLERVNKAMRTLVATSTPKLDATLFRAPPISATEFMADLEARGYDTKSLNLPVDLHPFLANLLLDPIDKYWDLHTESQSSEDGVKRVLKLANLTAGRKENATSPGLTEVAFKSWDVQTCSGARFVPEGTLLDGCTTVFRVKGTNGAAVTVDQFIRAFMRSLDESCSECVEGRINKRHWKSWSVCRFAPNNSIVRFERPCWEY